MNDDASLFIRLSPDHGLVLRVVQELGKLLKAVPRQIELRKLSLHPSFKFFRRGSFFEFHAVGFEHVPQLRQSLFGFRRRFLGCVAPTAFNDVTTAGTANVDELSLLQLLHKSGEASRSIRTLAKRRVKLQHGALQQAE